MLSTASQLTSEQHESTEPFRSANPQYTQIGALNDGSLSAITSKRTGFTSLYARTADPSHVMGLIGRHTNGAVWFHDNTGGLSTTSQGRDVLASVLDYMTKESPNRKGRKESFNTLYARQPQQKCALAGSLPLDSIAISIDGTNRDETAISDQFNCSEAYPCEGGSTATHTYGVTAFGIDAAGKKQEIIPSRIAWSLGASVSNTLVLERISENPTNSQVIVKAKSLQGSQTVTVAVQGKDALGNAIELTKTIAVTLCPHPWEYADSTYDFGLYYCRDVNQNTLLPQLSNPPRIRTAQQGFVSSAFAAEYIFPFVLDTQNTPDPNNTDVLIMRIGSNPKKLLLSDWYAQNVPFGAPTTISPIDGFEALQDESGIYVGAPDLISGNESFAIYFFALNKGAEAESQQMLNRLLSWVRFSKSLVQQNAASSLREDIIRYTRLVSIQRTLEQHRRTSAHPCVGNASRTCYYPDLISGTYIPHQSASLWPSWKQTLSNELGNALPLDPRQERTPLEIQCSLPFNKDTCWYIEENCAQNGKCSSDTLVCDTPSQKCLPPYNGGCTNNAMESNGLCKPKLPPFQLGTQVEDVIASGHAFTYTSVDGGTSYRLCARFDQYARMKSLFGIGTGVG